MDAKHLFFERYEGFREYPERLVKDLTEAELRCSPHETLNPISWTLWHITRAEDVAVNRLLTDGVQVFDEGGWMRRLRITRRDCGTGMPKDEAVQLCETIDLAELDAYRAAVTERTVDVVRALPAAELTETMTTKQLLQIFVDEGNGGRLAEQIAAAYDGHNKGWLLGHLVLTHSYYHIGQAFGVRAMLGAPKPW